MNATETMALRTIKTRALSGGVRLSIHAQQRSAERGISRGQIATVLSTATTCQEQTPGVYRVPCEIAGRAAKIVVMLTGGDLLEVVTVMWRTK